MFWKSKENKKDDKLAAPRGLPEIVRKYLVANPKVDAEIVPFLKAVLKSGASGDKKVGIAIFDPNDAEARGIKVQDYNSLTEHPELILYEGWVDEPTKLVELSPRKDIPKIKLFNYEEILQQIEGLKEPGSSVFFFMAAGNSAGGPLGRGAAVIKLNAPAEGKKVRKYSIYGTSVIDMKPIASESIIFGSDKAKDIAKWVAEGHKPRFC
jgi:hypothetical protein